MYSNNPNTEVECEGMFLYSLFETVIVLKQNQRVNKNSSSERFCELHNVRDGITTIEDWELLLKRRPLNCTEFKLALKLSHGNKEVAEKNFEALKSLGQPIAKIRQYIIKMQQVDVL